MEYSGPKALSGVNRGRSIRRPAEEPSYTRHMMPAHFETRKITSTSQPASLKHNAKSLNIWPAKNPSGFDLRSGPRATGRTLWKKTGTVSLLQPPLFPTLLLPFMFAKCQLVPKLRYKKKEHTQSHQNTKTKTGSLVTGSKNHWGLVMITWLWEADSLRFYFFPSTLFFALLLCFYTLVLSTQYYTHLQRTHTNIGIFFLVLTE